MNRCSICPGSATCSSAPCFGRWERRPPTSSVSTPGSAIPRDRRRARNRTARLIAFLEGVAEAAVSGLKEHDRLLLAREQMGRRLRGRRGHSKLPATGRSLSFSAADLQRDDRKGAEGDDAGRAQSHRRTWPARNHGQGTLPGVGCRVAPAVRRIDRSDLAAGVFTACSRGPAVKLILYDIAYLG